MASTISEAQARAITEVARSRGYSTTLRRGAHDIYEIHAVVAVGKRNQALLFSTADAAALPLDGRSERRLPPTTYITRDRRYNDWENQR